MKNQPKEDYLQQYKETIKEVDCLERKPTLFLHACCGPCLTYPLSILLEHFEVTVGFFNPNIQPREEYDRRLSAMLDFLEKYSMDINKKIPVVVPKDDFRKYNELFKDRIKDHEGGQTCLRCHAYRMNLAYEYAYEHHFDYFTTVMTVSCMKPSRELNEIAAKLSIQYPTTKYLFSDFKKENGQYIGIQIAKKYNVYRQNYCGCIPSLLERIEYMRKKEEGLSPNKSSQ
jgi:epoxyqueuosine reductase